MWNFHRDPQEVYYRAVQESKNRIQAEKDAAFQRRLTEKRRIARLPNCPKCGEKCEYNLPQCESCEQELVWAEYLIGIPGDENRLHQQLSLDERKYHKRRAKRREIRRRFAARESRWASQRLIVFIVLLVIAVIGFAMLWPKMKLYLPDISFD
jgi:hypothetical protein|tara:strand:+ start:300 stop:758 length:459 start_codon:yes stop_codon:yes gene_type:complete